MRYSLEYSARADKAMSSRINGLTRKSLEDPGFSIVFGWFLPRFIKYCNFFSKIIGDHMDVCLVSYIYFAVA